MTVIGDLPDQSEATGGRHGFGGASPVGLNSGGASPVQPPEIPGQILQESEFTIEMKSVSKTPSLASIYQARKLGEKKTVEALAKQFQDQIERIISDPGQVQRSHIPSHHEREVESFRKLDREKSFDEARTAVQSQIEKIFQKANNKRANATSSDNHPPLARRYKMHGISHIAPGDDSDSGRNPPPTHLGIKYAISNHPLASKWNNGNDTPPHSVYNHSPPVISRHDSIESLNHGNRHFQHQSHHHNGGESDNSMNRLSHHSSMFSLANSSDSIPLPSTPPHRKSGSAPPGHPIPAPRETLRRNKPYKSLADLSTVQLQQNGGNGNNMAAAVSQPIRLSPLDRSSSQLSLLYGTGSGNALQPLNTQTSNLQRQESLLDQARRISLGQTPSPPVRVARHHSQNLHMTSRAQVEPTSGQVKMTRSMSYVSSFSHLSVARNNDLLNEGLNGSADQGFGSHPGVGGGSDAQGLFQNPSRHYKLLQFKGHHQRMSSSMDGTSAAVQSLLQSSPDDHKQLARIAGGNIMANRALPAVPQPGSDRGREENKGRASSSNDLAGGNSRSPSKLRRGRSVSNNKWNSEESLNGTMGRRNRALPKPRHGGEGVNVIGPGTTGIPDLNTPKSGLRKSDSLPGLDTGGSLHSCPPSCTCSCSEDNISRIEVGGDAGDNKADKKGGVPRGILAGKNQNGGNGTLKRGESKKIKVEYLGSIPVESKATDLSSLQIPMKNMYLKYIDLKNMGHQHLPGTLDISETGLKVNYIRELHKGVQEIFNPFPTIAVWAAVKFVHKKEQNSNGEIGHKFAFLPLIADPDDSGKTQLFNSLSTEEAKVMGSGPTHPAMFSAVMRKSGVPKQLECHGFVCDSPEEAILIAANLYQALLETMKRNKGASSSNLADGESSGRMLTSDSDAPSRPPRRKRTKDSIASRRSMRGDDRRNGASHGGAGSSGITVGGTSESMRRKNVRSVKRAGTVRRQANGAPSLGTGSLTKRSSLRKSGSMRRAEKRRTVTGDPKGKDKGKGDIYTKELKEKEGIESVDDILREVIKSGGMSFNNIKPVYREMLMKLVMTMSKDEIFIRSKNIMNEQKKKNGKSWGGVLGGGGGKNAGKSKKLSDFSSSGGEGGGKMKAGKNAAGKRKISKNEIGNPVPIDIPKKFAVSVEELLEGVDLKKLHKAQEKLKGLQTKDGKIKPEDIYTSCSECGYQSACGSYCSCSLPGTIRRKKAVGDKSDSSGCSSCECQDCREMGDVCYSCSLYNESSNAGSVRMKIIDPETAAAAKLAGNSGTNQLLAPDSPLTAWRKNMIRTSGGVGDPEEIMEEMAGMSSTALPRPSPSSNSGPASALPSTSRPNPTNNPSGPASTPASLAAGLIPAKSPKSTKSSRRQARESLREADLQSSSSECPSLPRTHRPPRFRSASRERSVGRGTSRDRSGEGGRANRSIPSSVRTINSVKRTSSSQSGKPPSGSVTGSTRLSSSSTNRHHQYLDSEAGGSSSQTPKSRNPSATRKASTAARGAKDVVVAADGKNGGKPRKSADGEASGTTIKTQAVVNKSAAGGGPPSGTLKSEISVSADSLGSSRSTKKSFSGTNMHSSLGYLP